MIRLFTLLLFTATFTISQAQCDKRVHTLDVDSIFDYWQSCINAAKASCDSARAHSFRFDTLINFGDSINGFSRFHIEMADSLGGMNFRYFIPDDFSSFGSFFPDMLNDDGPFQINMDLEKLFEEMELMFKDFRGIEIIPEPLPAPDAGKKPTYRI